MGVQWENAGGGEERKKQVVDAVTEVRPSFFFRQPHKICIILDTVQVMGGHDMSRREEEEEKKMKENTLEITAVR